MPIPGETEETISAMPLGQRFAILFLWVVVVGFVFTLIGVVFFAFVSLIASALADHPYPAGIVLSLFSVGALAILVSMFSGAIWLTMVLEGRAVGTSPRHPARMICLPMVGILVVGGVLATLFWIPSIFFNDVFRTFPWPLTWGSIGTGAFFLYRHLDKILPR